MKALLVRVGIDKSEESGIWSAPVDPETRMFAYVPIRETGHEKGKPIRPGYEITYEWFKAPCEKFGKEHELPPKFDDWYAHLDPDFRYLTYGDEGNKGKQLENLKLAKDDILAFYAGLKPTNASPGGLVYALIGFYKVACVIYAKDIPERLWDMNAHTRREPKEDDVVVLGKAGESGRLERCITIGEYCPRGYYLASKIQEKWGEAKRMYLQRGPHHPLHDSDRFYDWFQDQNVRLIQQNNRP